MCHRAGINQEESHMQIIQLMEQLEFHTPNPYAQPLHVTESGRVLRFMLKPGQSIREHNAPHSPFFAVILAGEGMFAGGDGQEQRVGPGALLIIAPGESHSVRALESELVFVGFLHGIPPELRG
jgi:quercetin dioxygenase-like cupin family protein